MLAETSTVFLRSRTTSIAAGGTGLLNLVTSYAVPLMLTDSQGGIGVGGTALFFVGTGALGWILVFFFIPYVIVNSSWKIQQSDPQRDSGTVIH